MKHSVEEYKNFGKVISFESNGVVMKITLDIGPRIIYYGTKEMNFLKEDINRDTNKGGEYFDKNYKKGEKWYAYGGHRVWKSPEDLETYTPDNYPVDYVLNDQGGDFTTHIGLNFDYTLQISMQENGQVNIVDKIYNKSNVSRDIAVWGLTVMNNGGVAVYKKNEKESDLLPQQNLVYWPYNDFRDVRLFESHKYGCVSQTDKEEALKIGTMNKVGRAYYVLNGKALEISFDVQNEPCADYQSNMEIYTNNHILELEILSPMYKLAPQESVSLVMHWNIKDNIVLKEISDSALDNSGLFN